MSKISVFAALQCLLILAITAGLSTADQTCKGNATFDSTTKYDYQTPSPMNIVNSAEKPVPNITLDCAFILKTAPKDNLTMANNGHGLKFVIADNDNNTFSGGNSPSGDIYKAFDVNFYWTRNINEYTGASVDGLGGPIYVRICWYNTKYSSIENALNYQDGISCHEYPVLIKKDYTNKNFESFAKAAEQVITAGTSVTCESIKLWAWLVPETKSNAYIYAGAYVGDDKKQYNGITVIAWGKGYLPMIGEDQFYQFIQFRDENGELYENPITAFDNNEDRPVNHVQGDKFIITI